MSSYTWGPRRRALIKYKYTSLVSFVNMVKFEVELQEASK
jgi:hypothetical protein